jgi:hypothetical protein
MQGIITEIIRTIDKNRTPKFDVQGNDIADFELIKVKLVFKLVNRNRNREFLNDKPYIAFNELAIVFYVIVSTDTDGIATITVMNNLMKDIWDVDIDTLYEIAKVNTPELLPASIRVMNSVIDEMMGSVAMDNDLIGQIGDYKTEPAMYVVTNQSGVNGAAAMLYDGLLRDFADTMATDLYVILSSIHEVLLVRADNHMKPEEIKKMIHVINITEVATGRSIK